MIKRMSNAEYHAHYALGSTGLKQLVRSAAHYQEFKLNPPEQTPQMVLGQLVHCRLLEPETFNDVFVVGEHKIRRGKEYEKCVADNPGKIIITMEQHNKSGKICDAFNEQALQNPDLRRLLEGQKELAFFWKDPVTGIECKCKPDVLTEHGAIVDIKTTNDASFDAFQRQVVELQYHLSAAHYLQGVNEVLTKDPTPLSITLPKAFVLIAIETTEPYLVAIYYLSNKAIEMGSVLCEQGLRTYQKALETKVWAGYSKRLVEMDLPNYYYYRQGVSNE